MIPHHADLYDLPDIAKFTTDIYQRTAKRSEAYAEVRRGLLVIWESLREKGDYAHADQIKALLLSAGWEIAASGYPGGPHGVKWELRRLPSE